MNRHMDFMEFESRKVVLLGKEGTISVSAQVPRGSSWALYIGEGGEVLYDLGDEVHGAYPDNERFRALATRLFQAVDGVIDGVNEINTSVP